MGKKRKECLNRIWENRADDPQGIRRLADVLLRKPTDEIIQFLNNQSNSLIQFFGSMEITRLDLIPLIQIIGSKLCGETSLPDLRNELMEILTTPSFLQAILNYTQDIVFNLAAETYQDLNRKSGVQGLISYVFTIQNLEYICNYCSFLLTPRGISEIGESEDNVIPIPFEDLLLANIKSARKVLEDIQLFREREMITSMSKHATYKSPIALRLKSDFEKLEKHLALNSRIESSDSFSTADSESQSESDLTINPAFSSSESDFDTSPVIWSSSEIDSQSESEPISVSLSNDELESLTTSLSLSDSDSNSEAQSTNNFRETPKPPRKPILEIEENHDPGQPQFEEVKLETEICAPLFIPTEEQLQSKISILFLSSLLSKSVYVDESSDKNSVSESPGDVVIQLLYERRLAVLKLISKPIDDKMFNLLLQIIGSKLCNCGETKLYKLRKEVLVIITTHDFFRKLRSYIRRLGQGCIENGVQNNCKNSDGTVTDEVYCSTIHVFGYLYNYFDFLLICEHETQEEIPSDAPMVVPCKELVITIKVVIRMLDKVSSNLNPDPESKDFSLLGELKKSFKVLEKRVVVLMNRRATANATVSSDESLDLTSPEIDTISVTPRPEPGTKPEPGPSNNFLLTKTVQKSLGIESKIDDDPKIKMDVPVTVPGLEIPRETIGISNDHQFLEIKDIPSIGEMRAKSRPMLNPMPIVGKHTSALTYLSDQYRLLREDFVAPLRQFLSLKAKENHTKKYFAPGVDELPVTTVRFYYGVKLRCPNREKGGTSSILQFGWPQLTEQDWGNNDWLLSESLVLISSDNFETIYIATVNYKDEKKLAKGYLKVTWEGDPPPTQMPYHNDLTYVMAESGAYFVAYRYTLGVLQEIARPLPALPFLFPNCGFNPGMNPWTFYTQPLFATYPMAKYILDISPQEANFHVQPSTSKSNLANQIDPPKYLLQTKELLTFSALMTGSYADERIQVPPMDLTMWPRYDQLGMDEAQYRAFQLAITNELSIIQGPPGTGKTYIGLQLMKSFLSNPRIFDTSILVVCKTNHALDQFLEELLPIMKALGMLSRANLHRVGGGCESEILQDYVLKLKRSKNDNSIVEISNPKSIMHRIKSATKVIGMTTTGAAKYMFWLRAMKPKIVLVEEAAEVLEAQIITSITEHCEHLILIGDHKQLRPLTTVHTLAKNFHLDISLFERLIKNNLSCSCLETQHRMRPQIKDLLVPTIYEKLNDHAMVMNYPDVLGLGKNLFFINHQMWEKALRITNGTSSKANEYEAHYAVELCCYLSRQGYSSAQITVLSLYSAQKLLIQEIMESKGEPLTSIQVETVDSYQGEENDIVILSLVRSNTNNDIGFLACENRICVALSRAKHGLYIIGNMTCLVNSGSSLWAQISSKLYEKRCIGYQLELKCQLHGYYSYIGTPIDFVIKAPEGGCRKRCDSVLPYCKHRCTKYCHNTDPNHFLFRCQVFVDQVLDCGHINQIRCYQAKICSSQGQSQRIVDLNCREKCGAKLNCGHACFKICHAKIKNRDLELDFNTCVTSKQDNYDYSDANREKHECKLHCKLSNEKKNLNNPCLGNQLSPQESYSFKQLVEKLLSGNSIAKDGSNCLKS